MGGNRSSAGRSTDWPRRRVTAIALAGALTMACVGAPMPSSSGQTGTRERSGARSRTAKGVDQSYINARASVYGVAVDEDHIYWTDRRGGAIGRASRSGGNVKRKLVTGLSSPHGMAVDSDYIYWADSGSDSIGRAALDGSGADPNFITGTNGASDVAVDAHYVYWTNSGGIGRANLDGTGADLTFIETVAYGVDVDSRHLYWAFYGYGPNRGGVGRANVNGTGIEKKFVSARNLYPHGVAVDDAHVWWVEQVAIGRSALSGKNVKPNSITGPRVGHGDSGLADMAVDADGTPAEDEDQERPAREDQAPLGALPVRQLRVGLELQMQARQAPLATLRCVVQGQEAPSRPPQASGPGDRPVREHRPHPGQGRLRGRRLTRLRGDRLRGFLGALELALDQVEPGVPETRVGEIDADDRAELLGQHRAAGAQQVDVGLDEVLALPARSGCRPRAPAGARRSRRRRSRGWR